MLRIGDRYLVVDYKTNWLGDPAEPLTAADYAQPRLAEAMLHSDYPLQALLYCVVLHRFLRWRLPGYEPDEASRRRAVSVPARHVRAGHPGGRRPSGGRVQLAAAGVADHGDVGSARRGQGGGMTTVEWRQARGATGLLRHVHRRRGARVVGCACGAAAHRAGQGDRRDRRAGRRDRGAGAARTGRCAWTCGRSTAGRRATDLPWPDTDAWLAAVAASPLAGTPPVLRRRRRPAVPRPVLARGAAGLRRRAHDDRRRSPRRCRRTSTGCSRRASKSSARRRKSRWRRG